MSFLQRETEYNTMFMKNEIELVDSTQFDSNYCKMDHCKTYLNVMAFNLWSFKIIYIFFFSFVLLYNILYYAENEQVDSTEKR